ncbi:MAG TPA: YajQ family cyclic di-GMP-binding protein [Elusimicrobiales bacterium]|nr:YajQ family cyclic di-GMP-binding protein [Elusimicrobiales bacterium]
MAEFSFDIVSKVDLNTVGEAINVAQKEITNRYDFKGSNSTVELDQKALELKLVSSDEYLIKALYDVVITRISKRNVPIKNFQPQKIESSLGGLVKQTVKVTQGISKEIAKEIVRNIKDSKLKVTSSIQGESIRVSSSSKDALQDVMSLVKSKNLNIDVQFENYR